MRLHEPPHRGLRFRLDLHLHLDLDLDLHHRTARLLLDPVLGRLQGATRGHLWRSMPLASTLPATGDRETFARARWDATGLTVLGNQDSGVQGGLAKADWLIRCPPGRSELALGTMVSALQF